MEVWASEKTKPRDSLQVFSSRSQEEVSVFIVSSRRTNGEHSVFFRSLQKETDSRNLTNDVAGTSVASLVVFFARSKLKPIERAN